MNHIYFIALLSFVALFVLDLTARRPARRPARVVATTSRRRSRRPA